MSDTQHEAAINAAWKKARALRETSIDLAVFRRGWEERAAYDAARSGEGMLVEITPAHTVIEGDELLVNSVRSRVRKVEKYAGTLGRQLFFQSGGHAAIKVLDNEPVVRIALAEHPLRARSGEAEGELTNDEARKRMLDAISGARQGRVTGNGSEGDLFGDDADTEARLRNGVPVIALTDFNDALDRAFPALAEHPEPRRYSAEPEGREAVSGADLAQAIDGVPHEPRQDGGKR